MARSKLEIRVWRGVVCLATVLAMLVFLFCFYVQARLTEKVASSALYVFDNVDQYAIYETIIGMTILSVATGILFLISMLANIIMRARLWFVFLISASLPLLNLVFVLLSKYVISN